MRSILFLLLILLAGRNSSAQEPAVDVQHYAFSLTLSDSTDAVAGEAVVTLQFRNGQAAPFALDLIGKSGMSPTGMQVRAVRQNSADVAFTHTADRLTITPRPGSADYSFTIQYDGIPADGLIIDQNKYGDRTFFGDNWPNRARHWLPTVDHPSDKATVEFIVTAPDVYRVVGNGYLVEETDLGDGTRRTHWRTDVPIATKVTVIGGARFAVQKAGTYNGTPIQNWVYPQDREAGFRGFAATEAILRFFETNIGPFPYEKLANVQSKTRYGGMENASNIFYSENAVGSGRDIEGLVAHEVAHQWFGDSVTETDWPHIWLSEGFATYFTQLYMEATYGRARLQDGMARARQAVLAFYERRSNAPLVNPEITDPNEHLNPNSYQKGGWVLHMLRRQVGDEAFWNGIRGYYAAHRDGNASSEDFQAAMETASGQDLSTFFRQWLYQAGQPMVTAGWSYDAGVKNLVLRLEQTQELPFVFPLDVGIQTEDGRRIETVFVDQPRMTFRFALEAAPSGVVLDPDTWLLASMAISRERR